jgi:hypothetical protein
LALALGIDIDVIESWPASKLERWKAYDAIEPIPPPGWYEAQIAQVIANVNLKEGRRPYPVERFLLQGRRPRGLRKQTTGEVRAIFRAL